MSKPGMSLRVCGVTVRFTPSPASRVWGLAPCCHHGFADSPVSLFRHPLRGFGVSLHVVTTGSRTHPCLYSVTRFAGLGSRSMLSPRVRGLTRVFIPSPASRVRLLDSLKPEHLRSEERRVGKECRSRWSPYH